MVVHQCSILLETFWRLVLNDKELLLQSISDSFWKVCSYRVYAKISEVPRCLNVIDGPRVSRLFMIVHSCSNTFYKVFLTFRLFISVHWCSDKLEETGGIKTRIKFYRPFRFAPFEETSNYVKKIIHILTNWLHISSTSTPTVLSITYKQRILKAHLIDSWSNPSTLRIAVWSL